MGLSNFHKHCPKIIKNNHMLLLGYVFSGANNAALQAHPYGTTRDVCTVYKLLKILTVILSRMNQLNFKNRANFGSTIDYHQAMFFFLQVVSIGV